LAWVHATDSALLFSQGFVSYLTGDSADVVTPHKPGLVLAGGGPDNDNAMKWMLQQAAGGDVVVIRASGSDGYNSYFYTTLGIPVNSVETLVFQNITASYHPYILRRLNEAEVVFIAGGDQYDYYLLWRNTPVEDTLRYAITQRRITIGGTSAGMMVLSQVYYAPSSSGVQSTEALANPYHPYMNVLGNGDFFNHPWLSSVICDTHFDDRDRAGRLTSFMARMEKDFGLNARGIACNEGTAVCIDSTGLARVFGSYPPAPDYAYFVQSYCDLPLSLPETCQPGQPLNWHKNGKALLVYRVVGKPNGSNTFNLNTWDSGTGGQWFWWFVQNGNLSTNSAAFESCNTSLALPEAEKPPFTVSWIGDTFFLHVDPQHLPATVTVMSISGDVVHQKILSAPAVFHSLNAPPGTYLITLIRRDGTAFQRTLVKP
jgi:cyanophycinase-like exopeptidase